MKWFLPKTCKQKNTVPSSTIPHVPPVSIDDDGEEGDDSEEDDDDDNDDCDEDPGL